MTIRPAVREDVREMMEIFNYEVRNSTASFAITEQSYEERLDWFQSHGGEYYPLLTAEQNGRVAGYACLSPYRPYEAYRGTAELSVYVSPDFRRQGIGEALMRELLGKARRFGKLHSIISVITASNESSIRLHEKLGFSYCGTMHQVGEKFGQLLDIVNYELLI